MVIHDVEKVALAYDKILVWKDAVGLQAIPFGGYESRQPSVRSLLDRVNRAHELD